ncbi:MAG TPA: FecR domain-containing protein [Bryobacteraceae bacterium]|nr:FecR domain-containing protein [Bryobacteraceae bacterium]
MFRIAVPALPILAAALLAPSAHAQAVVSTRAGVVHFFEGAVSVAGQPIDYRLGVFHTIPEGAELSTGKGRAEILLTPGVFLRVDENTSVRLLSSALSDARVELLHGSAIVDSGDPAPDTAVTLIYKGWSVHQAQKGDYRVDSDPARVTVRDGEAQVTAAGADPVTVAQGLDVPLAAVLVPEPRAASSDGLDEWADGRSQSITADNEVAADIQDPADMPGGDLSADAFTYFPMVGLASYGYTPTLPYQAGIYGSQLGLYSMYLPTFISIPVFVRSMPIFRAQRGLYPAHTIYAPLTVPGTRVGVTPTPITHVGVPAYHPPVARPAAPAPLPRGGIHAGGGHR